MRNYKLVLIIFLFTFNLNSGFSQIRIGKVPIKTPEIDYSNPKEYEIGGIKVTGANFLDQNALIAISGLKVGDKIKVPGEDIAKAIRNLWKQGILGDIKIQLDKIEEPFVFLEFVLKERPRLSKFSFSGIRKGTAEDLREKIKLIKGKIVTDALLSNTRNIIKNHFIEKGFLNVQVKMEEINDTSLSNSVILKIQVNKNKKVKINRIIFSGNSQLSSSKLKRKLKETKEKKWYRIFSTSKFIRKDYDNDKQKLVEHYNSIGYRDAVILFDSVFSDNNKTITIQIRLHEGNKYYFRNISWTGNYLYSSGELSKILGIKKGDVYNQELLQKRLNYNPNGLDVSSLYLDDGYLFFSVQPVEVKVENDSIDIEMRIFEGSQATIDKVVVSGNTRTNDHVILREIRTLPGEKFSRADLIRSQRELAQLGFFDQEKLGVNPVPNPQKSTVDIEYSVEEKSSDQVEFSGGWGGQLGFVGTIGLSFNNFSVRKVPHLREWSPLPAGDGQKLALRTQLNGRRWQQYSLSFTEPWFGGKKPNSFTFSIYHSIQKNLGTEADGDIITIGSLKITGVTIGLGKRITWPDDYFTLSRSLSYQLYLLDKFNAGFLFTDGNANNFSFNHTLARNSLDVPAYLYPRKGSSISLSVSLTPPYSLFNESYKSTDPEIKYKWIEYHKWRFDASWFIKIAGNLVLNTRSYFGLLGRYNQRTEKPPFERFYMGGSGLAGFTLDGREIIALRGYADENVLPEQEGPLIQRGGTIFDKFTAELRFPLSLNPMATIYLLSFAEAGNAWYDFSSFNPFELKRSAGVGVRLFLPMFGMLGFDFGYGFDKVQGVVSGLQPHFIIGFQP